MLVVGAAVRGRLSASPEQLWAILADPTRHPELAGSGEPQQTWLLTEGPPRVGSEFRSRQRVGLVRYQSTSVVTVCDPPRLLRWNVNRHADWEFRLEPLDGGTLVTHSYRLQSPVPAPLRPLAGAFLGRRNRQNARGMARTLQNLARLAGAEPPTELQVSLDPPAMADLSETTDTTGQS